MRITTFVALMVPLGALAQSTATPIPDKHIPTPVLMDLRALEGQFDLALSRDCAPERCTSKGKIWPCATYRPTGLNL